MNNEKEVAAFIERIGKRLSESPGASHSGRHRAAFVALRELIVGAIEQGYTMKAVWAALRDEKKLAMSYQTFRMHCRREGIGVGRQAPAPVRPVEPEHVEAAGLAPVHPGGTASRAFRHERVPRKRDIYG